MELPYERYSMRDVLAVLVLYKCNLKDSVTFKSLSNSLIRANQQLDVLVYDNSPTRNIGEEEFPQWDMHYIHNPSNPGISRAYNIGFHLALQLGKKWLLLLDQDTEFPGNAISLYHESLFGHAKIPIMAPRLKSGEKYLSPCSRFPRPNLRINTLEAGEYELKNLYLLNSGLLVKVNAFEKAGGYNESIKLDFSDFAFLHRLKKHYRSFLLLDITAQHGFFDDDEKSVAQAEERFTYYCQGARLMTLETGNIFYRVSALARGLKLALRYRSLKFLKPLLFTPLRNDPL